MKSLMSYLYLYEYNKIGYYAVKTESFQKYLYLIFKDGVTINYCVVTVTVMILLFDESYVDT